MEDRNFFVRVWNGNYDKSVHFTASCILTYMGLAFTRNLWVLVFVLCCGIAKELRDSYRPGDHFDWYDMATNVLGVTAATVLWYYTLGY